jgi:TPR repeat protein
VRWFARAAESGDRGAWRRLGRCYAAGVGVAADPSEALKWLTLADRAGDDEARDLCAWLEAGLSARERWDGRVRARRFALSREE